jgi:hypothetical protein
MESAVLRLKETYAAASEENRWRMATSLVTALSAVLASAAPLSISQSNGNPFNKMKLERSFGAKFVKVSESARAFRTFYVLWC